VCRAIIGATPVYACPAGYSAQSAGCVSTATNGASLQASNVRYFHTDHLGSVTAITDETGAVVERLAYDAWCKRRFTNGTADVNDTVVGLTTDRGYTEHEELDELGIIHMNGRIYDPYIGRFMSADPYIQAPYELQSHNRYAYVMNNPLLYTDPSGYSWRSIFTAIVIIVAVVVTSGAVAMAMTSASTMTGAFAAISAGGSAMLGTAMVVGAAGGFVGGFLGAALNGASMGDSLKAGVIGGITGAAMAWAGGIGGAGEAGSNSAARYMAHAAVGCGSAVASGGGASGCGRGAAAALIGHAITNGTSSFNNPAAQFAAATVSGGVTSRIMGGSFANGATTAAYGFLFNSVLHEYTVGPSRICDSSQSGCTMSNVLSVVDRASTPIVGGLINDTPREGINMLIGASLSHTNPIEHYVDRVNYTVTNVALPGHDFYPGKVVHSLSQQQESRWSWSSFSAVSVNAIYLTTVGTGSGAYPTVNNGLGISLFKITHLRTQNYFKR
jgi:RHS repeat-associated protein